MKTPAADLLRARQNSENAIRRYMSTGGYWLCRDDEVAQEVGVAWDDLQRAIAVCVELGLPFGDDAYMTSLAIHEEETVK